MPESTISHSQGLRIWLVTEILTEALDCGRQPCWNLTMAHPSLYPYLAQSRLSTSKKNKISHYWIFWYKSPDKASHWQFRLWQTFGHACTARKLPFMYSFPGNCTASVPISTLMCLWEIYIFPGLVHIFLCSRIVRLILEIYNSLTRYMSVGTGRQNIIILFWKWQFHFWEYVNKNQPFTLGSHRPFICCVTADAWSWCHTKCWRARSPI